MVNKVILVGNLGKDPEVRYTSGGQAVATLRIATSRSWTDKQSGQRKEETEWHDVEVWGKQAEQCGEYLAKVPYEDDLVHHGEAPFVSYRPVLCSVGCET